METGSSQMIRSRDCAIDSASDERREELTMPRISRAELVERLAAVSHRTWMRQKHRDQGVPMDQLETEVTEHDRERAEDSVAELERLGLSPPELPD
jgi:hypothetical protein